MINPKLLINFSDTEQALKQFGEKEVLPISQEIKLKKRLNLDNVIFDILSLTKGERDAVYEAVIKLVERRLNKAKSLNQSKIS